MLLGSIFNMLMIQRKDVFYSVHSSLIHGVKTLQISVFMSALPGNLVIMILEFVMINVSLDLMLVLAVLQNIHGEIIQLVFVYLNAHLILGLKILLDTVRIGAN